MARIFVSYAHDDKDFTDSFVSAVREFYRRQNVTVWYDEDLRGGDHWWREIMRQLFYTDIFIYLMSKKALNSAYCQAEFREAYRLHKQIITVRVDEEIQIEDPLLAAIQYVDLSNGLGDAKQTTRLFSSLNEQLGRVPRVRLLPPRSWKRTPQPPDPDKSAYASVGSERVLRQPIDINTRLAYIQTITALVGILLAIVFGYIQIAPILEEWGIIQTPTPPTVVVVENTPTSEITSPAQEGVSTLSAVDATLTEIYRQFSFATETEQARLAPTQTAYATETLIAQATASQHALETAVEQAFRDATATQQAIEREVYERLATQITWTPTPTPTPTATLTALEQAIERARSFTGTHNGDWQPFSHVFADGVERVLVPVGCFMMGNNLGNGDEQPVHEQCITEPFWLDKYEVTNALYGSVSGCGYSSEADQPRNCVNWFDAQAFCEARGGMLPSEMQWEYAARGVEGLVYRYPWGNDYDAERVIGEDDPMYGDTRTAPVGSRPDGASWVGSMDMSGNVWEWTHTRYDPYPYEEGENRYNSLDFRKRVVRGGSFDDVTFNLRSSNRDNWNPSSRINNIGFRCALFLNNSGL